MNRAGDWLSQAERDLEAAENSAAGGFHEWAAFAAQQAAEKAVKALVEALHGASRGHSINTLFLLLPASVPVPPEIGAAARELDKVYVTSRYPNGFAAGRPADYFSAADSRQLIQYARAIIEFCRSQIHRP